MYLLKKNSVLGLVATLLLLTVSVAWAAPKMSIAIATSKEVLETVNGVKVKKLVPAKEVSSGDTLIYTLSYSNRGDEAAIDAVIDNPVPKGTSYVAGSATGAGAEITFSVDDGKTFARADLLMSEIMLISGTKVRQPASPEDYTHLRWMIRQVPAGASGKVTYSVRVK